MPQRRKAPAYQVVSPFPTMNTSFTEAFLSDCATSLSSANSDFHDASYEDTCYCKKNLTWVIKQVNAEITTEARHAVAKHYAGIIAQNNAAKPRGCGRGHTWVLTATEALHKS